MSFDATSPNGEGSWHLVGVEVGGMQIGIHLLLLGVRPPGLCTGSNSKLRFNVTQAITASLGMRALFQIRTATKILVEYVAYQLQ